MENTVLDIVAFGHSEIIANPHAVSDVGSCAL